MRFTRRSFNRTLAQSSALGLALGATSAHAAPKPAFSTKLDRILANGLESRGLPMVAAMVAGPRTTLYQGAFGKRDEAGPKIDTSAIFAIASMTKAITSAAALQLVEQGKIKLDEPVAKFLPAFATLQVMDGYESGGRPKLRPVRVPVTLRHLLTHTAGFAYDQWSPDWQEYEKHGGTGPSGIAPFIPLIFEPGSRWQYGHGVDWAGKLVEKISSQSLEEYFQQHILQPLGMTDTSFGVDARKFDRLVATSRRQMDGGGSPKGPLKEDKREPVPVPAEQNGGGGLFSTTADYTRFMQMILNQGKAPSGQRILQAKTVHQMSTNQIGQIQAGVLKSFNPAISLDVNFHPGASDRWGLGFLINTTPYPGGRSAGSLAWAGIANTYYWIDPKRKLCAVLMTQILPFADTQAVGLLGEFERGVYASL
jgi:CubicO group peptidase (beta-lactamase class C family)